MKLQTTAISALFEDVTCDLIPLAVLKLAKINLSIESDFEVTCDLIPLAVLKLPPNIRWEEGHTLTCDLIPLAVLKLELE